MIKKPQGRCLVVFLFLLLLLELKHISPEPFRQHIGLTPFILSFFNPHRMKILLPQFFKIIFFHQFINLQFLTSNKKAILKCLMHHCIFSCLIIDYKIPPALRPGAIAQRPGREAALCRASLPTACPASSVRAREGAGCGSVGAVSGA